MNIEPRPWILVAAVMIGMSYFGTAPIDAQVLLDDSFEDGDLSDWHFFIPNPQWTELDGQRQARNTASNQEVATVVLAGDEWSDYAVETDLRILDDRNVSQAGLVFRFASPFPETNYCRCSFFRGDTGVPGLPSGKYLRLICNGAQSVSPFAFSANQFYRLRATAVGKTVTCELLGHPEVPRLETQSESINCVGSAGLRSTHIRSDFDNFLVTAIPGQQQPTCLTEPIANAGPDQLLEIGGDSCEVIASVDGSGSVGPDGEPLIFEWSSPLGSTTGVESEYLLPLGSHAFVLTVTDSDGDSDSDEAIVEVVDTIPPSLAEISAEPNVLWPPNHKMMGVELSPVTTDNCDAFVACEISSVSSDEAVSGNGSGNTAPDWEVTGPLSVDLRAERSGHGDGRTYTIEVTCSDNSGNMSWETTEVRVPHSRR